MACEAVPVRVLDLGRMAASCPGFDGGFTWSLALDKKARDAQARCSTAMAREPA